MPQKVKLTAIVVFSFVMAVGGISYGMTGHVVPFSGTDQIQLSSNDEPNETPEVKDAEDNEAPETSDDASDDNDAPKPSHSPKPRSTDGCPEGFEGNHGQFVSGSDDKQEAAHSNCGKPEHSVKDVDESKDKGEDHGEGHGHGHDKSDDSQDDSGESGD